MVRNGAIAYGFTSGNIIVNLFGGLMIARLLGADGRGELTALLTMPQMLGWIFALGCTQAVAFHQARHPELGGHLLSTWLLILAPLALLAVLVGTLLLPLILRAQTEEVLRLARPMVLLVFYWLLYQLAEGFLLGDHDFLFAYGVLFANYAAVATAFIVLWLLGRFTVETALVATVAAGLVMLAACTIRILSRHPLKKPSGDLARATAWYGARAHLTSLSGLMNSRLDLLVLPAFVAATQVGLYAVATSVSWLIVSFSGALSRIVLPVAARKGARGREDVIRSVYITLAVALVTALGLALIAETAVRAVYGASFQGSVLPLRLLLPGCAFYATAPVLWAGMQAAGRPFTAAFSQLLGLIVTVVGLLLFLPRYGIVAASIVSTVSYSIVFVAALISYRLMTGPPLRLTGISWLQAVGFIRPTAHTSSYDWKAALDDERPR